MRSKKVVVFSVHETDSASRGFLERVVATLFFLELYVPVFDPHFDAFCPVVIHRHVDGDNSTTYPRVPFI